MTCVTNSPTSTINFNKVTVGILGKILQKFDVAF